MPRKVEISHRTIIFTFLLVGAIWLVIEISQVIFLMFLAIIFMSALNPAIDSLQSLRIPRWLAITLIYIVVIGLLSTAVASIIPPLVEQTANLINHLPDVVTSMNFLQFDPSALTSQLSSLSRLPGNIVKFTASVFSNVVFLFTLAVLTFYLLLERRNLNKYLAILFDRDGEKRAEKFVDKLEQNLGGWVRGELILMLAVGLITYVGLIALGVPYALPLAIIAGFLEIIPSIGPVISAIPAIMAGFLVHPYTALAAAALYFVVQQLENSILVPKIMQRATGVNPLVSLVALIIGFNLAGPAGAIVAIPTLLVVKIVLGEVLAGKRFQDL